MSLMSNLVDKSLMFNLVDKSEWLEPHRLKILAIQDKNLVHFSQPNKNERNDLNHIEKMRY